MLKNWGLGIKPLLYYAKIVIINYMNPIDQLVQRGWGGYAGWSPTEAMADFQKTGGQGKQTQQTPPGYQFGQTQSPQGGMFSGIGQGFQQGLGQAYDWATQQAQNVGNAFLPTAAKVTQAFGIRSPYDVFSNNINTGVDFATPEGTPVIVPSGRWRVVSAFNQATRPGFIGDNTNLGYGNSIMLQNMDSGERLRFSHLSKVGVTPGQILGGGVVGLSGRTGNASGPHLDVEYYDSKGKLGDPLKSPFMQQKMMAMGRVKPETFEPPKPVKGPDGKEQAAPKPNPYNQNIELTKMFLGPKSRVETRDVPQQQQTELQNPFEPGVPLT